MIFQAMEAETRKNSSKNDTFEGSIYSSMTRYIHFYIFFMLMSSAPFVAGQDLNTIDMGGNWKLRKFGSPEVYDARVPGSVHLDLMRNGTIKDPFYRDNEADIQWIGESDWEYIKVFDFDESLFAARHIELVMKGLDTYANVYVNDSLILSADNMFRDWVRDVKRYLRPGKNTIRIFFKSVVNQNKEDYSKLPYKLPGDERSVCRKAAYQFGWDWSPTLVTMGIWKPIYLRYWNYVNVLDVRFIQKSLTDSLARMSAVFTMRSDIADTAVIKLFNDTVEIMNQPIRLVKGPNVIRGDFSIRNPQRWWPNGLGNQTLYSIRYEVYFAGRLVGDGEHRIGLRTVELVQEPDSAGRSFYFRINGIPVFMKGANYVPQDNFPTRVKDSTYRALIADVRDAKMNMLRVWGGGIYESDLFYDLCDENGIMVWQDFMFANQMFPGTKAYFNSVRDEAVNAIMRLRKHPSIVLWCGNNEIDEGWKNWNWQRQYGYSAEDSTQIHRAYRTIFNEILPNNIRRFDTLRPYIPSSPLHGWGREISVKEGDLHYWGVWWGKEPFSIFPEKTGRFMSEYGFQAFPDLSTIRKFTLPDDRKLGSPVMKAHQKHPTGYETIDEYLHRDYRKPRDFESYAMVSQLLQAEGIKTAIEAHRRARPYCMGTLFWQLNDSWPVVSWSARDYYGQRKALFHFAEKSYGNLLISPVNENGRVRIYIVSDVPNLTRGTMKVRLYDFSGKVLLDEMYYVDIPGNSSEIYYDTLQSSLLANLNPAEIVFSVSLTAVSGMLSSTLLYFTPPKDLNLAVPKIDLITIPIPEGFKVRLTSDVLVKNAFLSTGITGVFTDNYFDLLPGQMYEVQFRTRYTGKDLPEKIKIKSLVDTY
jgi:beta-mannosidase